jgi:hypothetical protein
MVITIEQAARMQSKLSGVTDKRRQGKGNIWHKLVNILVMAFTAVLCGFKEYDEMEQFCKEKAEWFRKFLEMPYGVPDAITFYRILRVVDPVELAEGMQEWLYEVKLEKDYEINIDGKTMRGSIRGNFRGCHIVSAWVGAGYLSLGQVKTDAHSNEITAIPELLDLIDIKGARITIDVELRSNFRLSERHGEKDNRERRELHIGGISWRGQLREPTDAL